MIRFMLTVNDVAYALPFMDFSNFYDCQVAMSNMAQTLNGWLGVTSYEVSCTDRTNGLSANMGYRFNRP